MVTLEIMAHGFAEPAAVNVSLKLWSVENYIIAMEPKSTGVDR